MCIRLPSSHQLAYHHVKSIMKEYKDTSASTLPVPHRVGEGRESTVYTMIDRRKNNQARVQETNHLAQHEYLPKLQKAPGFVGFYLVNDTEQDVMTAVIVWESKTHADNFSHEGESWAKTLEEHGHRNQSFNRGETVMQVEPKK